MALGPAPGGVLPGNKARRGLLPVHHCGERLLKHVLPHGLLRVRQGGAARRAKASSREGPALRRERSRSDGGAERHTRELAAGALTSPSTTRRTAGRPRPARVSLWVKFARGRPNGHGTIAQRAAAERKDGPTPARIAPRMLAPPLSWPSSTAALRARGGSQSEGDREAHGDVADEGEAASPHGCCCCVKRCSGRPSLGSRPAEPRDR